MALLWVEFFCLHNDYEIITSDFKLSAKTEQCGVWIAILKKLNKEEVN